MYVVSVINIKIFFFQAKEIYHTRCLELERLKRDGSSQKEIEKVRCLLHPLGHIQRKMSGYLMIMFNF